MSEQTLNQIITADCREALTQLPSDSIDLVFTSPPYANQRMHTYGGIDPDKYVEWFLPISAELLRTLKPEGSFVLNIKERVVNGERHTYILDWPIQPTYCIWLQSAPTVGTVQHFRWNFPPGSSGFSHLPAMWCSIHSSAAELQPLQQCN